MMEPPIPTLFPHIFGVSFGSSIGAVVLEWRSHHWGTYRLNVTKQAIYEIEIPLTWAPKTNRSNTPILNPGGERGIYY
jgi:hypothetical protein